MNFRKLTVSNFKCFGEEPTMVEFNGLTSLIGHNSSGKTSLLLALRKLFGEKSKERLLTRADFNVPKGMTPDEMTEQNMFIEAEFDFPELDNGESSYAIPTYFEHFIIDKPDGKPYMRIRLEGTWKKSSSTDGSIESNIYYITTSEEKIEDDDKKLTTRHDLDNIKMIYVPAIRNPSEQLKNVTGTIISRILNGINWTEDTRSKLKTQIDAVDTVFDDEDGVSILKDSIDSQWKKYHSDHRYSQATLKFNSTDLESILKKVEIKFSPTEVSKDYSVDELGDGLRSLFYLSLINTLLKIEQVVLDELKDGEKASSFSIIPPALTIVTVEEPENHISPHLLGKVVNNLIEISTKSNAQTIITSHAPSIVKRIDPEDLRYFRMCKEKDCTRVKKILLPNRDNMSIYKYVKGAVKAYPELYFSKLVILGEGDSEEIIIPKILEVMEDNIDAMEISVVPLGGRHVNHFWKLLYDLDVPFITLLDLDRERSGGGWGRVKYVLNQLLANGVEREKILRIPDGILTQERLDGMHNWDDTLVESMNSWIKSFETHNIFFSYPLDIDFVMLKAFGEKYKAILTDGEGPFIKEHGKIKDIEVNKSELPEYKERMNKDIRATLKPEGGNGASYSDEEQALMVWYNYFFLNRGKPTTHIITLESITDDEFKEKLPSTFSNIIERTKELIKQPVEKEGEIIETL